MTFQVRPGVEDVELLAVDSRARVEFAYRQPGIMRRTTGRSQVEPGW